MSKGNRWSWRAIWRWGGYDGPDPDPWAMDSIACYRCDALGVEVTPVYDEWDYETEPEPDQIGWKALDRTFGRWDLDEAIAYAEEKAELSYYAEEDEDGE